MNGELRDRFQTFDCESIPLRKDAGGGASAAPAA